jgi:hypothetical protein
MNPYPPDPLTPEERELALLTSRLGPHGEPSPTLDASILAAAHAAVSGKPAHARRKPRWPVAMGLAASVVFAVGIAWQLRPMQENTGQQNAVLERAVQSQAPADADASKREAQPQVLAEAESPIFDEMAAGTTAAADLAEPAPVSAPKIAATPKQEALRSPPPLGRAVPAAPAEPRATTTEQSKRRDEGYMAASPPPPAPPMPQAMAAPAPAADSALSFAPDPETRGAAASIAADAAANSSARPAAARRESKAVAPAGRAQESAALDSVQVTGSRVRRTDLQVPVSDDAQLAVNDWLERVRTRYGLGDADAARQSLLLFVKDHPSETVPDDLEPLLDE